MTYWHQQGEIAAFDPLQHGTEALATQGLVIVATSRPTNEVFPGMQTGFRIDKRNIIIPNDIGAVIGDVDHYVAAGRLLQQVAYGSGLPPGHAGLYFDNGLPEALASAEARTAIARRSRTGEFVGYFCMADREGFEARVSLEIGGYPKTRRTLRSQGLVGLTVADIDSLLGGGIDALRDPADHPIVRQQHVVYGLRPERHG